jgi:hypothetical protein
MLYVTSSEVSQARDELQSKKICIFLQTFSSVLLDLWVWVSELRVGWDGTQKIIPWDRFQKVVPWDGTNKKKVVPPWDGMG